VRALQQYLHLPVGGRKFSGGRADRPGSGDGGPGCEADRGARTETHRGSKHTLPCGSCDRNRAAEEAIGWGEERDFQTQWSACGHPAVRRRQDHFWKI
ncbi:Uncharacterized protein DAT39_023008, partial [Clarias magur]